MEVQLKKKQLVILCKAMSDSIVSPSPTTFYWRQSGRDINSRDFAVLFEIGLMEWQDYVDVNLGGEGFITTRGRQMLEELDLCSLSLSK